MDTQTLKVILVIVALICIAGIAFVIQVLTNPILPKDEDDIFTEYIDFEEHPDKDEMKDLS